MDGNPLSIRVGARCVETLHPTFTAECVLGLVRVERVARQVLCTLNVPVMGMGRNKVNDHMCKPYINLAAWRHILLCTST